MLCWCKPEFFWVCTLAISDFVFMFDGFGIWCGVRLLSVFPSFRIWICCLLTLVFSLGVVFV